MIGRTIGAGIAAGAGVGTGTGTAGGTKSAGNALAAGLTDLHPPPGHAIACACIALC